MFLVPGRAGQLGLQLAVPGGSSSSGTLANMCSLHSAALPMLKKYMLQHIKGRLREQQQELFCVPMRPGLLRKMQNSLRPSMPSGDTDDLHLPAFDVNLDAVCIADVQAAGDFGRAVGGVLFFHIIKNEPRKLVHVAAEMEVGFDSADIVIAPHRVLSVDAAAKHIDVDSLAMDWMCQGEQQPFILSLESLSCEELLRMLQWQPHETLSFGLWGHESFAKVSRRRDQVLSAVLEDVLAKHKDHEGYVLDSREPGTDGWKDCLRALATAGLLACELDDARFSSWLLTEQGNKAIKAGYKISKPARPLAVRSDVDLADRANLGVDGHAGRTRLEARGKRKGQGRSFCSGSEAACLQWYSKPGDESVSFWYLLSLAQGTKKVPHWRASSFYQALVEGKARQIRARRRVQPIQIMDAWDIPVLEDKRAGSRRRGRKRPLALQDVDDQLEIADEEADLNSGLLSCRTLQIQSALKKTLSLSMMIPTWPMFPLRLHPPAAQAVP